MAEIEFDDVTKRYADGFEAVKHFNLDVHDGELMILVGPSGSGKSTALRMVAGLEDISAGELKIGNAIVNDRAPKDRDIAMVFQNYALYPHMTVRENMGFALKLAKDAAGRDRPEGQRGREDPRPRAAPRPQARQPVRRPAPAGRDGSRDRPQPEGIPDGRAAVEPRREAARADADRDRADPAAAGDDHDLRHPRPDRGDDARRPDHGDARRRAPAGRPAVRAVYAPRQPVRRRLHRLAVDELPARDEIEGGTVQLPIGDAAGCPTSCAGSWRPAQAAGGGSDRGSAARALRGRERWSRPAARGRDVQGEDRRARVDGVRVLRVLRGRGRAVSSRELEELAQDAGGGGPPGRSARIGSRSSRG